MIAAAAALFLVAGAAGSAPAVACAPPATDVEVAVLAPAPDIRRELDVASLSGMAAMGRVGATRRIVGLTEPDFRFEIDRLEVVGAPGCWSAGRLEVTLAVYQTVHLARLRSGSDCHARAILEHELQHVAFNRAAVEAAAGALRQTLASLPPSVAEARSAALGELEAAIVSEVGAAGAAALARAQLDHQRIDGEDSFRAIWDRCGGAPWPWALPSTP